MMSLDGGQLCIRVFYIYIRIRPRATSSTLDRNDLLTLGPIPHI